MDKKSPATLARLARQTGNMYGEVRSGGSSNSSAPHFCAPLAYSSEVLTFIDAYRLDGQGLGIVDVHLLASTALAPGTSLWTRDARLRAAASSLGMLWRE